MRLSKYKIYEFNKIINKKKKKKLNIINIKMLNNLRLNTRNLIRSSSNKILSTKIPAALFYNLGVKKNYNQIKDLNQTMYTAEMEEAQRKAKFLEYTTKIYKPSKTITFDRNGEVLLFACDNIKHSQVYLKYPYCLIDSLIPLGVYIFFCDPCNIRIIKK